jgi:dolichol-phosphate mannosyltransferase
VTVSDRTIVVLPTYNERDNLPDTIQRIGTSAPHLDILVVDDNSPDGTGQLADRLARTNPQVRVLHRPHKAGLGSAYLEGFAWAIEEGYDVVVECDADGSHHPEELHVLLDALDRCDMVIGSRWVRGGSVVDWPRSRELLSHGGSAYARRLLGLRQHDVTGGYRAFRTSALLAVGLDRVTSQGYCFQIEMLWRANRAGISIAEVPITFTERRRGDSKMRGIIVIEALLRVTLWGLQSVFGRGSDPVTAREASRV